MEISQKIRVEERKLMIAQRKLESIRTLEKLFERIQVNYSSLLNIQIAITIVHKYIHIYRSVEARKPTSSLWSIVIAKVLA